MSRPKIEATCCPGKVHYAKGWCRNCYGKQPEQRAAHAARQRLQRATDPEWAERQREACRRWAKLNPRPQYHERSGRAPGDVVR